MVLIATLLSVVLTAAYATRALIIATTHVPGRAAHRPALTWSVAGVLTVLTVGALTGGLLSRSAAFALPSRPGPRLQRVPQAASPGRK